MKEREERLLLTSTTRGIIIASYNKHVEYACYECEVRVHKWYTYRNLRLR